MRLKYICVVKLENNTSTRNVTIEKLLFQKEKKINKNVKKNNICYIAIGVPDIVQTWHTLKFSKKIDKFSYPTSIIFAFINYQISAQFSLIFTYPMVELGR